MGYFSAKICCSSIDEGILMSILKMLSSFNFPDTIRGKFFFVSTIYLVAIFSFQHTLYAVVLK